MYMCVPCVCPGPSPHLRAALKTSAPAPWPWPSVAHVLPPEAPPVPKGKSGAALSLGHPRPTRLTGGLWPVSGASLCTSVEASPRAASSGGERNGCERRWTPRARTRTPHARRRGVRGSAASTTPAARYPATPRAVDYQKSGVPVPRCRPSSAPPSTGTTWASRPGGCIHVCMCMSMCMCMHMYMYMYMRALLGVLGVGGRGEARGCGAAPADGVRHAADDAARQHGEDGAWAAETGRPAL